MSELSTKRRNSLPKSDFALPKSRKFPVEDKAHARNALSRVSQSENKGNISSSEANKVRAKANKVLNKGSKRGR